MVYRDGEILLIKEKKDDLWSLPGGWADIGESPAEATAREVREESGSLMRAVKLVSLYDRDKHAHRTSPTLLHAELLVRDPPERRAGASGGRRRGRGLW